MPTCAAQAGARVAGAAVRAACVARLLLAAPAAVCIGSCPATVAQAQAVGSIGPSFELTDHNGSAFSSVALAGHPYAVFLGFTHCPDVCPTTLLEVSNVLQRLGPDSDRLRIVFITVDPERDTPEQLRQYLSSFDRRIIGLTGTPEQIAAVTKGWNAFHNKIPEGDGTYTVVHSAYVYLMDRRNRLVGTMGFLDTESQQLERLKRLLETGDNK